MRRRTHILAPALVVGAMLFGGYRLAGSSQSTSPAAAVPAAIAPAAIMAVSGPDVTGISPLIDAPAPTSKIRQAAEPSREVVRPTDAPTKVASEAPSATPTVAPPTATAEPTMTATAQPTNTPTSLPTDTPEPTATATRPRPTAKPALLPPSRVIAPVIGLDSKVVTAGWHPVQDPDGSSHTEWDVPSYAVGWNKISAKPGEVGNVVLTGHNNIEGEVFRNLEKFQLGDEITVYAGNRAFKYYVTDKFILQETDVPLEQRIENAKWIGWFPDQRLTLISCWPVTNNTHRIFIIAKPKPNG